MIHGPFSSPTPSERPGAALHDPRQPYTAGFGQDIRPGQVMTDEQYTSDYAALAEETQNILRRLCDEAMGRKITETKP